MWQKKMEQGGSYIWTKRLNEVEKRVQEGLQCMGQVNAS